MTNYNKNGVCILVVWIIVIISALFLCNAFAPSLRHVFDNVDYKHCFSKKLNKPGAFQKGLELVGTFAVGAVSAFFTKGKGRVRSGSAKTRFARGRYLDESNVKALALAHLMSRNKQFVTNYQAIAQEYAMGLKEHKVRTLESCKRFKSPSTIRDAGHYGYVEVLPLLRERLLSVSIAQSEKSGRSSLPDIAARGDPLEEWQPHNSDDEARTPLLASSVLVNDQSINAACIESIGFLGEQSDISLLEKFLSEEKYASEAELAVQRIRRRCKVTDADRQL